MIDEVLNLIQIEEFEILFKQQYSSVYNYIIYHIRNADEAEDLTADVFFRAYKYWGSYSSFKGNRGAWVGGIARNVLKTYYKKHANKPQIVEISEFINSNINIEEDFMKKEAIVEVLQHINTLSEYQQELLTMKYLLHFTNQEIAKTLGISVNNIGVTLHRTINKLKKQLSESNNFMIQETYLNL